MLVGLFVFATWLLGIQGVWHLLLSSDPTGITLIIIIIFAVATLWCGVRSRELARQRDLLSVATAGDVQRMIQAEGLAG